MRLNINGIYPIRALSYLDSKLSLYFLAPPSEVVIGAMLVDFLELTAFMIFM